MSSTDLSSEVPGSRPGRPGPRHRLVPASGPAPVPALDPHQRAVVDHPGGPLLVLAGPGTGKTTTLVEAVVDRVERRGAAPEQVLALTFSRKAAEQLRDRVAARLDRALTGPVALTFHSFAYGLLRRYAPAEIYSAPLRLLSAPEADVVLGELLRETPEATRWPADLGAARRTRGFAREVAAVLARAREKGLEPEALSALGWEHGIPEFRAAGSFLQAYLDNLDYAAATDYPDLIRRAVIEARAHREELRAEYQHLFVDEYQDTDPGQVALLQALAGEGRDLVAVGDPHQSIYGFRGAEVRGILDFPTVFPRSDGTPAPVTVLRTTRRFGPELLGASRRIAARLPLAGTIAPEARAAFLDPRPDPATAGPGRVEVYTYDSERSEAERLADLLRRAHLDDGLAWSDMAVLVRSGRATLPGLRRALGAAGVPVELATDETPLAHEPAVAPLLSALRAVAYLHHDDPAHPTYLDAEEVRSLLLSPLVDLDPGDLRAVARELRRREVARDPEHPRSSADLVRAAVADATLLAGIEHPAARRIEELVDRLDRARSALAEGGSAEDVLWALWSSSRWPERLRRSAEAGGPGSRAAHRDLDAVLALFDVAAKTEEQRGHTSVPTFLDTVTAQELPADTLAERGVRGAAVRLLTAHRSKGLEWPLVVVAHVQEGGWPDLRRRTSLLGADRIGCSSYGVPALVPDVSVRELLAEERRLFYVACTRARRRLVVTAVRSTEDDGDQPSRFLTEPGVDVVHQAGRPPRQLTLAGVVAEMRRTLADPATAEPLRDAAAARLAALAPTVSAADPAQWWGTRAWSRAQVPVRPAEEPLRISATSLTSLLRCPAQWFWQREAGGSQVSSQAQGVGKIVHALAEDVATGSLQGERDLDRLMEHVATVWDRLSFRSPWSGERERVTVEQTLRHFLTQHYGPEARTVLDTEVAISTEVTLPDGERVLLNGFADRIEIDADGDVVVVDLKTSKSHPTGAEIAEHPQLGLYQYAVDHGALSSYEGHSGRSAGAELWQLRHDNKGTPGAKVQAQPAQEPNEEGHLLIERQLMQAAAHLRGEDFPATPGPHCDYCPFAVMCPAQTAGTVLS